MTHRHARPLFFALSFLLTSFFLTGCPEKPEGHRSSGTGETLASAASEEPEEIHPLEVIKWTGKQGDGWKNFDELLEEQKHEEASKIAEEMLRQAKSTKNSEEWVRALIRYVQLRSSLHGYETAVKFLKKQEWPKDLLANTVLNLFYAQMLQTYADEYSWEIRQRERVESKGVVDLKALTMDEIYEEAQRAFESVWKSREPLGKFPTKHLAEFINLNNYPRDIRPTLRDAVSYLRVALLIDKSGWRPEHENEIYQLDLGLLLGNTEKSPSLSQVSLIDPAVHPLLKICAILEDLELWHTKEGEKEAAFEARLTRLTHLHDNFTQAPDRERIKKDLEERLPKMRKFQWWSMGLYTLAEFVRKEDTPDNLIRARKIAEECHKAYPESIGGHRCLHTVRSIERPDYRLDAMATDNPQKPSIGVHYKNLKKLYFRAYPVDIKNHIEKSDDYYLFPDSREIKSILNWRKPSHHWEVALSDTPDFKNHWTYITPPMEKPGFYIVIASARKNFKKGENQLRGIHMLISDLVLLRRHDGNAIQVDVLSGSSGRPVSDATVFLYKRDRKYKLHVVESKISDHNGTVRFKRGNSDSYFIFAEKDKQIAIDTDTFYFRDRKEITSILNTLIYTDRSVYRPLQTIHFKAVVYRGRPDLANFRVAPSTSVVLSLIDANRQEVATQTLTTNSYGSASGEFTIPAGRLLGRWQIESSKDGLANIRVEEYKRPTFETKFLDPKEPLRLNKPATLQGEARYYFGLPVSTGKVIWRVKRTPVLPWWWYDYSDSGSREQLIDAGTEKLKEDGTFTIRFTPEVDERLAEESKDITYQYTVSADVTDEGGETRSATRSFRLGFVAVEANVVMDTNFFLENQPGTLEIMRTNLDGIPSPGNGSYRIVELRMPEKTLLPSEQPLFKTQKDEKIFRTPDDMKQPRWNPRYRPEELLHHWDDGVEIAHGGLAHDDKGYNKITLPALPAGVYRLHYTTKDAFGADYKMQKEFLVVGKKSELALPAYLAVEKSSVKVGEKARIFVASGLQEQPIYLDFYRDGKLTKRQFLESGQDESLIEIPITEDRRGGFGVSLKVLRDHQLVQLEEKIFVPWDNKELKVTFSTFRDLLRPGGKEKWTVKVTGPAGRKTPVRAAEVLAYMYDRSLDVFAPHTPPIPLSIFPSYTQIARVNASVGRAHRFYLRSDGFGELPDYPSLQGDTLKFYSGYGFGGIGWRRAYPLMEAAPAPPQMVAKLAAPMEDADVTVSGLIPAEPKKEVVPTEEVELRTDFSETAFFKPHLLTRSDGSVSFEFDVPDSVTSWNAWTHAITRDFKSGSVNTEAKTVKDLMVRPYLPRFLREGDAAELKVVVNNASDNELKGHVSFDIIDPETEQSLLKDFGLDRTRADKRPFTAPAKGSTNLSFPIKTPSKLKLIAFRVMAISGDISDGELRPIPILPGRMHLAQSRFVALKDKIKRELYFEDLAKDDDPTRINEQMVITIDAQLFYSILSALPYLVNYPYECTEQTLNRFISTGILSSLYKNYPAIERMAKTFAKRKTQYESWDAADPNRKMALEETPWLQMSKGRGEKEHPLINVLDPRIARAQMNESLAKLKKVQTSSGAFPWFPGGKPSPYMTLYILYGFSKGLEFGVDVPKNMIQQAWRYMHRHYVDEIAAHMMKEDCCFEFITFLNYVLSNYPDASWTGGVFSERERKQMLKFSFKHWKKHSPYLKGYLSLTLNRMDRPKDAILVWESVMDSAKTKKDQGTFWAPEDRSWLWYNDTIETHAFAIRTMMELMPKDEKLDGLVLWIFLNKKLNHWKSTRATAEVIYSLANYLKATAELGVKEEIKVTAGDLVKNFVFLPDEYTGKKNQIVIDGKDIDPKKHATILVEKETKGFAFASSTWHFSTEKLPDEARGDYLLVTRNYFKRVKTGKEVKLLPLKEGAKVGVGDEVEVHISLTSKHTMEYVFLRDPRPAGFEPVDFTSKHKYNLGLCWYEEIRDSGTNFFFEALPHGNYPFKYRLRAAVAGTFKAAPATVQPMYAPEFVGYSLGRNITIMESKL